MQQPVQIVKFGQLVRSLLQVFQIQGHRSGPPFRIPVDLVCLVPGQAEAQLLGIPQDVFSAQKEIAGIEAGDSVSTFKDRPQLFEILRDQHHMQPIPGPVCYGAEQGEGPIVPDQSWKLSRMR